MDWYTILTTATTSLGISAAGAWWLSRTLIQHKLNEAMENHKLTLSTHLEGAKADLQRDINREKAGIEGAIKQEVDTYLGKAAAQRQYEYDARKRLYTAIARSASSSCWLAPILRGGSKDMACTNTTTQASTTITGAVPCIASCDLSPLQN